MTRRCWLLLPCIALLASLSGFVWFASLAWQPTEPPPSADGIVVLTGGVDRIGAGLHLLQNHAASRLLISGVGRAADAHELAHLSGVDSSLAAAVTLGRQAHSTHGNAMETAQWAEAQHVHSLIVVTASYHMQRALAELHHAMPGIMLFPFAVQPPSRHSLWDAKLWRLLGLEYVKFLAVKTGLSQLADHLPIAAEHAL